MAHHIRGIRAGAAAALAGAAALALAGCGSSDSGAEHARGPGGGAARPSVTVGVFLPPAIASNAFTYDVALVPENSTASVSVTALGGQTRVSLDVTGLKPGHGYGAHAQTAPCGADPAASGEDYQDEPGTGADAVDADNELWLDFTTDTAGSAHSTRTAGWRFRPGEARSLVLFENLTSTNPDAPGDAGARIACLDVDF